MIVRRIGAAVTALFFVVCTTLWPARSALAITLPTKIINGVHVYVPASLNPIATIAANTLTRANPIINAITVGSLISRLVIDAADGSKTSLIPPNIPSIQDVPTLPADYSNTMHYGCSCNFNRTIISSSLIDVCQQSAATAAPCGCKSGTTLLQYACAGVNTATGGFSVTTTPAGGAYNGTTTRVCPSGYTWDSAISACRPNAATSTDDPYVRYKPKSTGDGWDDATTATDPPADVDPGQPLQIDTPDGPASVQITPTPGGGITVQTRAPDPAPAPGGTPTSTVQNIVINNQGAVTSTSITTVNNTSIVNNTNGQTLDLTGTVTDSPLAPPPDLYTRQYPEGLRGVWNGKIAAIKATPLFALAAGLVPSWGDGGCPVWTLPASPLVPGFAFPGGDISIPCWVWSALRIVIIITALFLCRALIFGG